MTGPAVVRRWTVTAAFALALLAVGAVPASAHDVLAGTDPAAGSVVAGAPSRVRLTFGDPVLDGSAQIRVDGPSGVVSTGAVTVTGRTVVAPLAATAAPGRYTVLWRATSRDGHPVSGRFTFTLAAPGTAASAPASAPVSAPASAPVSAPASAPVSAPASPGPAEPAAGSASATPVATALLLTGAAVAAGMTGRRWSRRRRTDAG